MYLGIPPPQDRQDEKDAEQQHKRQRNGKKLKRGNRDVDKSCWPVRGNERSPNAKDDHSDGHTSSEPAHVPVQAYVTGTNKGDLDYEECEPYRVDNRSEE